VLRFSTATVTAVQHGGIIYPCAWSDDPAAYTAQIDAEAAVRRRGCQRVTVSRSRRRRSPPSSPERASCWPPRRGAS